MALTDYLAHMILANMYWQVVIRKSILLALFALPLLSVATQSGSPHSDQSLEAELESGEKVLGIFAYEPIDCCTSGNSSDCSQECNDAGLVYKGFSAGHSECTNSSEGRNLCQCGRL